MRTRWKSGPNGLSLYDRFWQKVSRNGRCWEWNGCRHKAGYGRMNDRGTTLYAHRLAYEFAYGVTVPPGIQVCHHCDNPPCCNPAHLFLGTQADNNNDKARKGRTVNPLTDVLKRKTHCPKGHAYDEANTLWRKSARGRPSRACRECLREWARLYYWKKRASG